jgi:hypothetical protein
VSVLTTLENSNVEIQSHHLQYYASLKGVIYGILVVGMMSPITLIASHVDLVISQVTMAK